MKFFTRDVTLDEMFFILIESGLQMKRKEYDCYKTLETSTLTDTFPAEISCFHDYDQEFSLSSLYYLKIGRINRQK